MSAIIINPPEGGQIFADTPFDIIVITSKPGPPPVRLFNRRFTYAFRLIVLDSLTNCYSLPQQLDADGIIIGYIHVTIQNLGGSFTPDEPLKADAFKFFKGINDAGDGKWSAESECY